MRNTFNTFILAALAAVLLCSCAKWEQTESVEITTRHPWDRNPELWAEYTASLRAYKEADHFLSYARLDNAPQTAVSEKSFMRNLPDSLDIVSLTNADNFSAADREDMAVMREKGTKVLYQVDFASRSSELSDAAKLGAYLDRAIASVQEYGLDGYSFTGTPKLGDAAYAELSSLIVDRLSSAKKDGQMLVFEGDPMFVAMEDMEKIDLFVLATEDMEYVQDVRIAALTAISRYSIPKERILLAAKVDGILSDEEKIEHPALEEMTERVMEFGPLCGIAAYNIASDYWHSGSNYTAIRAAIQTLNPSR